MKKPILIASVNTDNLLPALDAVRGCWKATTMLWMHAMGVPVLSGVVVPEWSSQAENAVRNFCRRKRVSKLLLRIDKRGQRWTRRRGGYVLPMSKIRATVNELSREGMITILLEPASPYSNYSALGAVTVPNEGRIVIEAVGPGFDASDILRSDLEPHERFEARLPTLEHGLNALKGRGWKRTYLVDSATYRRSVERRLAKIGARLESPPFPDAVLHSPRADRKELIRKESSLTIRAAGFLFVPAPSVLRDSSWRNFNICKRHFRPQVGILGLLSGQETRHHCSHPGTRFLGRA